MGGRPNDTLPENPTPEQLERYIALLERRRAAEKAKDSFLDFVRFTTPDPEHPDDATKTAYHAARVHKAVAAAIEEVEAARIKFLILTVPPRHGKTELVSRRLPAWYSGRHPEQNVVVASYNDDFAMDIGRDVRRIIENPLFRQVFPEYRLTREGKAADRLITRKGGMLAFVGRGGSLTGRGAHLLVMDDLLKDDKEASSQAIRDQAWNWFTKVAMTRRMGHKLVIMTFTRWHADDPIGRLTDPENPNYNPLLAKKIKIINLPALAEAEDPLGRQPGEALWPDGPDRFDEEFLREQQSLDPLGFAALYQQRPSMLDGDLFRRENIRFYKSYELPDNLRFYAASDHAVATGQRNDFTVLLLAGAAPNGDLYLVNCWWDKKPSDVVVEAMLDMGTTGNMRPLLWWAERGHISKSIGPFLNKRMLETGRYMNVVEVTPIGDKAQRAQSIAARVAMGKVLFPSDAVWTERAISQMMSFPNGTHDDFVDTLSLVGLGMQHQWSNAPKSDRNKNLPREGTLNWVKLQDRWHTEQRERAAFGGF